MQNKCDIEKRLWIGVWLIGGLLLGGAAPAGAQGNFGISGGGYQPEGEDLNRTEVFGLRGGYRFHPSWGLEASLSRTDLPLESSGFFPGIGSFLPGVSVPAIAWDFQADNLYNFDFSLQWFPRRGHFVVFGGPGIARLDTTVNATIFDTNLTKSTASNSFVISTVHAGLAYDWQFRDRFFIRPETRVRRYFDDHPSFTDNGVIGVAVSYDATDYEGGVTLGWRFGS